MASSSSSLSSEQQPRPPFRPKPSSSSSFIPSHLCLEFLSCLQTDQIMQIHKINDVVIPTLIHNLSKCNPRPLCSSEIGHRSPLQAMYDKIYGDFSDIKETLERLKEWEDRLNTLTKNLMLFDWKAAAICTEGTNSVEVLQTAIPKIHEMVSGLKSHISLPLETCLPPKSSDISLLPIPKNRVSNPKWSKNFPETDAFVHLKERYDSLNFQQRESLLYFSFFPANSLIRKKVLTYLWIGEGVVQSIGTGDSEEIAGRLFEDLTTKGFIEPVEEKDTGDFNVCSIKPDVQSALLRIAHTKGFFDFDSDGNPTANSCRAYLEKTDEGSLQHLSKFSNHDKLRTLFNINENCLDFPSRWLSKTKKISVIHLGNWTSSSTYNYIEAENPNFLEDLRDAKLLMCLSLNGISGITKLPDSISASENLNILDLKFCRDLEKLPRKIGLLKKLTHLDMSGCYLLDEMPKGIAHLSELRVLKGFIIGSSRKGCRKWCTLSDLVKLEKLRKLGLYADKVTTGENGELNCLTEFRSLRILTISWIAPVPPKSKPNKKHNRVASPSLPIGLQKLDLRCWPLSTMPSWIKPRELSSLKKLYISGGNLSGMQIMQPEGHESPQWTIKILRLKFLKELNMNWEEARTSFPSLVYFEKVDCPQLSSSPFEGVWISEMGSTSR